nr:cytochrome P450 monooxygenase CYP4BN52 [Lasioderma serricorne]
MIWLALFVIGLSAFLWWYFEEFQRINGPIKNIPGPPALPLLGSALDFPSTKVVLKRLMEYKQKYGKVYKVRIGPFIPQIVISDVKQLEVLLSSTNHISKSINYKFLDKWLGTGLLTSDELWRRHRKIITPTFHFKILEDFIDIFNNAGEILIEKLKKEVGKSSFNFYPYISLCALDIICETAMGTKVNAQNDSESEYVWAVKQMCRLVIERSFSAIKFHDFLYQFTEDYRIEMKSLKILHGYTKQVIASKKLELANRTKEDDKTNDVGLKKRMAFLDLLIRESNASDNPLTDEQLREEVDTFMFEGHDTTATAMSYIAYALAENPDVQRKVAEEQEAIFGTEKTTSPTFKDISEMKYLEMVIKEALRLYPSVPFYARSLLEDLEIDGQTYARDSALVIFAYGMHRDPDYFPNPEKFDPERFGPGAKFCSPYVYIPFSAGVRNCIGQKFAMLEMKSAISKLVRNFEFLPADPPIPLELTSETVLKSVTGIHLRIKERL